MKDLRPLPRPVELALPPRATVIADKVALFPPTARVSGELHGERKWHTPVASNNKVDLGSQREGEMPGIQSDEFFP